MSNRVVNFDKFKVGSLVKCRPTFNGNRDYYIGEIRVVEKGRDLISITVFFPEAYKEGIGHCGWLNREETGHWNITIHKDGTAGCSVNNEIRIINTPIQRIEVSI